MASGYDGTIRIDSRIDSKGFNSGVSSMTNSVKGLASAVGVAFGTAAVVNFGKTAVQAASTLASAMTGLQSVMNGLGRSFSEAQKFITDYTKDGLIPATNAITAYKNLALRGYDTGQIEKVLTALKDSAAFGRQASYTMGEAVQSASEGLKNENSILVDNAGVTKNVAQMWKEYAESIGTTSANLTKQQKIQAEVNGILEESKFQTGDAAKMAGGYAGKLAALSTSFYNLKVAIGNSVIPIISRVMPYIQSAVNALVVFFNKVATIMSILFGVDISEAATQTQKSMDSVADSTNAAADAQDNLAYSTNAAGKAAKGALAAFDQLDVLQQDTGAENSIIPIVTDPGMTEPILPDELKLPEIDTSETESSLDNLKAKVEAFKESMIKFFEPLKEPFKNLKGAISELGGDVWGGIEWAYKEILVPLGEWLVQKVAPVFLDLLTSAVKLLDKAFIALEPDAKIFFEKFLKPMAEWTGGKIVEILGWLKERLDDISKWIEENPETFATIVEVLASFAAAWLLVHTAVSAVNSIMGIATSIITGVSGVISFLSSPIGIVILAIGALVTAIVLLNKYWPEISSAASSAWAGVQSAWSSAGEWFSSVTSSIGSFFSEAWEGITSAASSAWAGVQSAWKGAKDWFGNTVIDPIKDAFGTSLDWIEEKFEKVFESIKGFVKGSINSIIDFINGMITSITTGVNGVIDGINSIEVTIPSWVPKFGGDSFGPNIPNVSAPQIPRLAKGAVIPPNSEFAAILGDQKSGRNLEAPEGLIRQIIHEEISNIQSEVTINFSGSLGALVRELHPYIQKENIRIGGSLIKGNTT